MDNKIIEKLPWYSPDRTISEMCKLSGKRYATIYFFLKSNSLPYVNKK